jgi:hypothetical protein
MSGRPKIDGIGIAATLALATGGGFARILPAETLTDQPAPPLTARAHQRELRSGMQPAEVVAVLGTPDVITRGAAGREAWMWDAVPQESLDLEATGAALAVVAGAGARLTSGPLARRCRLASSGCSTLTVIVGFDESQRLSSVRLLAGRS